MAQSISSVKETRFTPQKRGALASPLAHRVAIYLADSGPEPQKTRLVSVSQSDLFSCWRLATKINVDTVWRVASKEQAMPNRERTGAKLLRTYSKMAFNLRGSRCGPCRSLGLVLLGP
jgi:hypothetical protein